MPEKDLEAQFREIVSVGGGKIELFILFKGAAPDLLRACQRGDEASLARFTVLDSVVEENLNNAGAPHLCLICPNEVKLSNDDGTIGGVPGFFMAAPPERVGEIPALSVPAIGFVVCAECARLDKTDVKVRAALVIASGAPWPWPATRTPDGQA